MKDKLKEKYVPPYYYDRLFDRWHRIFQNDKSVKEYVSEFDQFFNCYNIIGKKSDTQVLSQFWAGLRVNLKDELW